MNYNELAHYIGRLGAHCKAVSVLVTAWLKVPSLRTISRKIRVEDSAEVRRVNVDPAAIDPYQISRDICKRRLDPLAAFAALHSFVDIGFTKDLKQKMHEARSIITRVHAELLLLDRFARQGLQYVDGDVYVGCSKPACFFCYSWLREHHSGPGLPAGHNKVVLGCRGPDGDNERDVNRRGARLLGNMRKKMENALKIKIVSVLQAGNTSTQAFPQHTSTNGSSRAPSVI